MSENVEQRTEQWLADRAGKITASVFGDCTDFLKDGKTPSAKMKSVISRLARERVYCQPSKNISAPALTWGTECEESACHVYQLVTGNIVTPSGLIIHPDYPFIGASPDGLIDDDGGIEIKCPYDEDNHLFTIESGEMPEQHIPQVQGSMFVTGRKWWSFVSFDPRAAPGYRLFHKIIERDESYIGDVLFPALIRTERLIQERVKSIEAAQKRLKEVA